MLAHREHLDDAATHRLGHDLEGMHHSAGYGPLVRSQRRGRRPGNENPSTGGG